MDVDDDILDIPTIPPTPPPTKTAHIGQGLVILFQIYFFIVSIIFVPYYNWQYARTNGFMDWLWFGEIVL
jgi:hypothetical protein